MRIQETQSCEGVGRLDPLLDFLVGFTYAWSKFLQAWTKVGAVTRNAYRVSGAILQELLAGLVPPSGYHHGEESSDPL